MPDRHADGPSTRLAGDSSQALQSLQNPTESAFTAQLDLLADTQSTSQWPTLPLSPRRAAGASSSLMDGQPAAGNRPMTALLDTLPRHSTRLPSESGFDLLAGGSDALLHSVGASLPDPANLHKAADAQPQRASRHNSHRPESITLPPPPPRTKPRPSDPTGPPPCAHPFITPPSPHSSWLSTSESDTDCSHRGLEPATPSPNPPTQPPPRSAAIPKPPDLASAGRFTPKLSVPRLAIPRLSARVARPAPRHPATAASVASQPAAAASQPAAAASPTYSSDVPVGFGYESLRSPSTARSSTSSGDSPTATMGSAAAAPAWMSTGPPAGTPVREPGILTPRTPGGGAIPCAAPQERLQPIPSATPSEYATAMSSVIHSNSSSAQVIPSRPSSGEAETPLSSRRPLLPPPPAEASRVAAEAAQELPGSPSQVQWVDSLSDHPSVNRAWANPFFAVRGADASRTPPESRMVTPHSSRQRGTYPGTILSSHPDSENFQLPSNEQSTFDTSSQAGDHSGTLSRDASVPAAIMSLLGEINDIEQRISSEWAAEQQLRADEIASLPSVAEEPAPLRGPRSRFTPDDVVAAARDGMRTARAHRVASRELPELPPETSRTLPESPRDWEERAAELEEQLVEQRLESARERADMEAKLLATERQLALSARAAAASPQLSLHNGSDGREVSKDVGAAFEELQQTTALVASFEAMMHERLDPLTMHLTGMKRRMLSAQEEATSLRSELATAQQRCTQLQAELQMRSQETGGQPSARDTARTAASSRAGLPPLAPGAPTGNPEDVNALLRQLQLANAENAELRATSEIATERERSLQAIVDGRGAGDQLVPHAVHAEVLHQNKVLTAQVQQLRSDLEVLYMDDMWRTNPDGPLEGTGTGASSAMPSAMNTVARLGALIGVSDSRTIMRSLASHPRPSRSLGSTHGDLPDTSSALCYGSFAAYPSESAIRSQREVVAPITPELAGKRPSADSTPSTSLMGAPPLIEASGDLDGDSHWHGDPSYMGPSPSMLHAVERGAVMHIREQTAERLVTTLQNQAASIVEKDTLILRLEERVRALEAAAADAIAETDDEDDGGGASGESAVSGSVTVPLVGDSGLGGEASTMAPSSGRGRRLARAISADRAAMPDWETLPVPNTFKEALEQILMLQVENSRLKDKLGTYPTHSDNGLDPRDGLQAATGIAHSAGIPRPPGALEKARQPSSKTKAQQSRMRTLSNARKTLASMQTLADAMSSVQGQHLRPPEAGTGDGVAPAEGGGDAAASGPMVVASGAVIANGNVMNGPELEVEVFKDLVMRELSDQVVAWQLAHGDVSKDLVAANMRLAELQTEHDQLVGLVKSLSCKPAHDMDVSSPQKAHAVQTPSKTSRLGFFGRLKPPRRQ